MNQTASKLDCLTIDNEIINLNCDWNVKAVLQYIKFRLNLKDIEWTFTNTDISHALNIHHSNITRLFKEFIRDGVFTKIGEKRSANGFKMNLFRVNSDGFKIKIDEFKMNTSRVQNEHYKKEYKRKSNKKEVLVQEKSALNDNQPKELPSVSSSGDTSTVSSVSDNNSMVSVPVVPPIKMSLADEFDSFFDDHVPSNPLYKEIGKKTEYEVRIQAIKNFEVQLPYRMARDEEEAREIHAFNPDA